MTASIAKENSGNASASACIPIAGFKDVYEVSDVEKALQELSPSFIRSKTFRVSRK